MTMYLGMVTLTAHRMLGISTENDALYECASATTGLIAGEVPNAASISTTI